MAKKKEENKFTEESPFSPEEEMEMARIWQEMLEKYKDADLDDMLKDLDESVYEIEKLSVSEWTETNPEGITCPADKYYANVANRLLKKLISMPLENEKFNLASRKFMAKTLAAYLEDFVSDLGVWNAFRNAYKDKYGKFLPFFDTSHEEYYTDDINIEDVKFLLWQCWCRVGQHKGVIYSPLSPGMDVVAQEMFDILVEEAENAPAATRVHSYIRDSFRNNDIYKTRDLSFWLCVRFPLFYDPSAQKKLAQDIDDIYDYDIDQEIAIYSTKCEYSWDEYFGPLGISSATMVGLLAREYGFEDICDRYSGFIRRPILCYNIIEKKEAELVLEDFFGDRFEMPKDSVRKGTPLHIAKGIRCALVKVGDKWLADGLVAVTPNSFTELQMQKGITAEVYNQSGKNRENTVRVIEAHGGQRVYCLKKMKDIEDLLGEEFGKVQMSNPIDSKIFKDIAVLLSDTGTKTIIPEGARYFPLPGNKLFKKKDAEKYSSSVFINDTVEDDVAQYIADNNLLPYAQIYTSQGGDTGLKIVQENLQFLSGFYRTTQYDPETLEDDSEDDWEEDED